MYPTASIVYGIDLGQLDFDDIDNLERGVLKNHETVEIETYGEQSVEEYHILTVKEKNLPTVVCEAKKFDPLALVIKPHWNIDLQKAISDINKELNIQIKNEPHWFLIEVYGG